MYQSEVCVSRDNRKALEKLLDEFLEKYEKVYCKALKRSVSLAKLPDAILNRPGTVTHRLRCFFVALDILRRSDKYTLKVIDKHQCYEVRGLSAEGIEIAIHLREERGRKDRTLYMTSLFPRK